MSFAHNYKSFDIDYFHQQDRNDFTPSFERTSYSADSVKETEAPGFQIAQVKAEDEDPQVQMHLTTWNLAYFLHMLSVTQKKMEINKYFISSGLTEKEIR